MLFFAPARSSQTTRHQAATLQSSWAVKTGSSSEYQEAGGRQNQGIGYKPALQFAKNFSKTQSSETILAGQVRWTRLEVCRLHFPPRHNLIFIPGSVKLCPYVVPKKGPRYRPSKVWRELMASRAGNASEFCEDPEKPWFEAKHSVSVKSSDQCRIGSWVFARIRTTKTIHSGSLAEPPEMGATICGRIVELLAPTEHVTKGIAVIEVYQMLEERHPIFGMPRLAKATADGKSLVIVSTEVWISCCPMLVE